MFQIETAHAAPLVKDYLFPAGGQRGTSVQVTAVGKFDPWPAQAWTDSPALHIQPGKEPGTLTVQIDKDAPLGPHLVRLYNADGASMPRCFLIGDQPEVAEVEPNDEPRNAQVVKALPITINGQLEKPGDVDCYAVTLQAGQRLVASVHGRRLGSPIDPMLHLLDTNGNELAFAHDGLGLDPLLTYVAAKPGKYIVRISAFAYPPAADVKLAGGKGSVYRLSLTTGPFVRYALPAGVMRGKRSTVQLFGWNLGGEAHAGGIEVDATGIAPGEDHLFLPIAGGEGRLRLEVGDGAELLEAEAREPARILSAPLSVSGRIDPAGDEDRFPFPAKKGERLNFALRAAAMGSPLEGLLRLEDGAGKSLARDGESGAADPKLDWTAPADGTYRIVVSDLYHKGGGDYFYRLEMTHPAPSAAGTLDNHEYHLMPGKSVVAKLTVSRKNGHAGTLVAVATGLPAGVTATSAEVSEKSNDASLTLTAAADAKPAGQPIRFLLLGTNPAKPEAYTAIYNLRAEKDGAQELIEQTEAIWLTVQPAPPATKPTTQPASQPASKPLKNVVRL